MPIDPFTAGVIGAGIGGVLGGGKGKGGSSAPQIITIPSPPQQQEPVPFYAPPMPQMPIIPNPPAPTLPQYTSPYDYRSQELADKSKKDVLDRNRLRKGRQSTILSALGADEEATIKKPQLLGA